MSRRGSDRGQAAGVEAVPFGVLVFVTGMLIAVNAWGVVTARGHADAVAREYLRAYTEAPSRVVAITAGRDAAARVAATRRLGASVRIEDPATFAPCAPAVVVVRLTVPLVRLPFIGGVASSTVRATRRERVDAYRAGVAGDRSSCGA